MTELRAAFNERAAEVEAYLDLVAAMEHAVQKGIPLLVTGSGDAVPIAPRQQRLLYAVVYLHLYNLVEATVSQCITAVEEAASGADRWRAGDLSVQLRKEWVRSIARTHEMLNDDNRLEAAVRLCDHLVAMLPVKLEIDKNGGGNWDDEEIFRFARRIGVRLELKSETARAVKQASRDGKGTLKTIKYLRNKLAHGEMSFAECGDGLSVDDLRKLKTVTVDYLEEVVGCFEVFIQQHEFLEPTKRPARHDG